MADQIASKKNYRQRNLEKIREQGRSYNKKNPTISFRLSASSIKDISKYSLPEETPSATAKRLILDLVNRTT